MPYTPVRDIELIDTGSLGKEVLSNDAFTNLAHGISGTATMSLSSTDHTLSTTEGLAFVLILTGTLTANVNVLVPAESRVYVIDNRTSGSYTVTCRPAAGGGVAVDQSARTLIYCDGSTVYPVASGTGGGGGGSGAPTDASYLVGAGHALLSGERVVTDTSTITWDLASPGQARAIIPPDAVSYTHLQNVASSRILGRFTAGAGDVQEITPGTGLVLDAGTGVLSATAVGQPLDATLTALAGLATGANLLPYFTGVDTITTTTLSAFVRTILDDADAATVRGTISAQASDATLTALAGVSTGADTLPFFTGVDTASTTVLTAFMRGLLDDPDLATAQATLGITGGGYTDEQAQDAVGTILVDTATIDLTYTDATPSITAAVVAGSIGTTQLANDSVTYAKLQNVTDARLLGRSAGSAGDAQEITVSTGLALSGGVLSNTVSAGQPLDATLTALAGLATGANQLPYATGTDTFAQTTLSAYIRTLLDDADAATARGTLLLGTMAQQDAANVAITGGSATGLTAVQALYFQVLHRAGASAVATSLELNTTGEANRYNLYAPGTAPNHLAGPLGIQTLPIAAAGLMLFFNKSAQDGISLRATGTDTPGGSNLSFLNVAGTTVGRIHTDASTTSYATSSDVRLKHAITALTGALDRVRALRPVSFFWNADGSPGEGFRADELQQVIPAAVTGMPDAVDEAGNIVPQGVDHSKLVPWLTAALQESVAQVQTLTARVAALEAR